MVRPIDYCLKESTEKYSTILCPDGINRLNEKSQAVVLFEAIRSFKFDKLLYALSRNDHHC